MKKRLLSMILASAMVFGMLIIPADAEDPIVHNIAATYRDKFATDQNMMWFLMDYAVYEELYPDSEYILTAQKKAECYDAVLAKAQDAATAGELAKDILASSALGYDASSIAAKLTALVDAKSADVTNIYTLSYAIIALQQGADYATADQMRYLVNKAISSKKKWQDAEWGIDATAPMILALAPYYDIDAKVRTTVDEAVEIIRSKQDETGLIDNAASTALAIVAFAALGIDTDELAAGLMTQVNETNNGFEPMKNSFSTEEGWRALLANELAKQGKRMYDFSGYDPSQIQPTETPTVQATAEPVATATAAPITAYVTVSRYGDIVKDKDGKYVAEVPVELTGKETYNIDDALRAVHEICYQGGAASGYNASVGEWGLSLNKLWGDRSMRFGYCVNGSMANNLGDTVSDGDYVDACIYESYYPDTEGYAKFDKMTAQAYTDNDVTITLYASTGWTADWSSYVFDLCGSAAITVNGEATSYVTDSSGNVTLSFDEAGTYIISASKTKVLREEDDEEVIETTVTAITAPVCVIYILDKVTVEPSYTLDREQWQCVIPSGSLPEDTTVYAAVYDEHDKMLSVGKADESEPLTVRIDASDDDKTIKIFAWYGTFAMPAMYVFSEEIE